MSDWYLYDFTFRGRHSTDQEAPGWRIILRNVVTGQERLLNVSQAAAEGWTLNKVVGDVAAQALTNLDAQTKRADEAESAADSQRKRAESAEQALRQVGASDAPSDAAPDAAPERQKFLGIF